MKIFVLGGGTAGWLTALFLNKTYPSFQIELIESEDIGVLGAGESTTMPFFNMLNYIGIDHTEFRKETRSTCKSAVRFDDWNLNGEFFVSPMYPWNSRISAETYGGDTTEFYIYCLANGIDIKSKSYSKIALQNKSPFALIDGELSQIGGFTYQINAKLTAAYLRKIAIGRGVIRHEGKVTKINGRYPVQSVEDDKGNTHEFDFVFDCSGFARLIVGKHYETKWIDYSKHLTVDSAIPFFLDMDKEIPPYSQATAMNCGWMFKVPTQDRYGSGYVFDSSKISAEDAKREVETKLGHEVTLVNNFKFKAGVYENNWIDNCISLGLAGGFLEPMSATNIGGMIYQLEFIRDKIKDFAYDSNHISEFNEYSRSVSEGFLSLIFSHYLNPIRENEFWDHYKDTDNYPKLLTESIEKYLSNDRFDIYDFAFSINQNPAKLLTVFSAHDMYKKNAQIFCDIFNLNNKYRQIENMIDIETEKLLSCAIDHREFLEKY